MAKNPEAIYQIKGVDRATPADESAPGTCLAIENLVPVGPPDAPYWSVATAPSQKGSSTDILSLGRQTRERLGPLADSSAYPNVQSKDRLLALKADGIYVIDPNNSYAEAKLYDFIFSDTTRRATFTSLGESTFILVTRGTGVGFPEVLLEVRDDAVDEFRWPALPEVSVDYTDTGAQEDLEEGTYVWRFAWLLDDGSVGPASGPLEAATGAPGNADDTFTATFTIESFPETLPASWQDRVSNLLLIAHAPVMDGSEVDVKAINAPAYVVDRFDDYEVGTELTYGENRSELIANEVYEGSGFLMHEIIGGAAFSYNKRLILGDVGYDLYRPDLRKIVEWEEGVQNANGDDHWLLMRVRVRTPSGIIERLSEPLPFDTDHADATDGVNTRHGIIWYRDSRAVEWAWFSSSDYSGSIDSATWKRVSFPNTPSAFKEAGAANVAYARTDSEPIDITNFELTEQEITGDSDWTDQLYSTDSAWDTSQGPGDNPDSPHDATIDIADFTSDDLNAVTVDIDIDLSTEENGSTADADASAEVLVEVYDGTGGGGTLQDSVKKTTEGTFTVTLSNFTLSSGSIRIYTEANALADASGDDYATANAAAEAAKVTVETSGANSAPTFDLNTDVNQDADRDPNRVIWSEPYQPVDFPVENLVYAGDENADPVLALTSVGQTVSEGQFGQYPIIVLSKESIRLLEVGQDPFIRGVSPLTGEMGIVGRRAFANTDGIITAVTDRGVYQFTPQLQQPALSEPLHDVRDAFLNDVTDPDTAVGFYAERDRGRRELWIAGNNQTWCYSLKHGLWCQLSRQRVDFARLDNRLRGIDTQGQIQREFGSAGATVNFTVVTGLEHFGEVGYMERLKTLLIQSRFMMEELKWELCTKDPNASQALKAEPLNRASLPDGLTARDLLPNVLVESGTDSNDRGALVRGDIGTIPLASALGYSWFCRFEGTGEPDQGIEGWGAEFQPRRRVRPATFFPDQPQTVVLDIPVDVEIDEEVNLQFKEQDGTVAPNISAILWGDGTTDATGSATHTYASAGSYVIEVVAQPDFDGIDRVEIFPSETDADIKPDLPLLFSTLPDLTEVRLGNVLAQGTPTEQELEGIEVIDANSSFAYERGGTADIKIDRLDPIITDLNFRATGWGVSGDWGNVSAGEYPNLKRLRFADGGNVKVSGTLTQMLEACTGLVELIQNSSTYYLFDVDATVSEFQAAPSTLSTVRINSFGTPISGVLADFDHPDIPTRIAWTFAKGVSDLSGELGALPSRNGGINKWSATNLGSAGSVTADAYDPAAYNDWSTLKLDSPGLTNKGGDVLVARAANEAQHLDNQPSGYFLSLTGTGRGQSGSSDYLNQWVPEQHPFRALGAKPNVSWSIGGNIDTSAWNPSWAVAGGVVYQDSSGTTSTGHITVDKPTTDGASDTQTDDGSAVPTDSTLPDANGGNGAILHVFEDDNNETGPGTEAESETEYIVETVTDNGDGTITFDLDTTNGPALNDASSADLTTETRIAVTW